MPRFNLHISNFSYILNQISADGKDNDTNNQEIETVEQQISLIKGQIEVK